MLSRTSVCIASFRESVQSSHACNRKYCLLARLLCNRRRHVSRHNSKDNSKENIHDHYDLGNRFFPLFLDDSMTYSCALFESQDQPLNEAQAAKYREVCEKAGIEKGNRVLEIGTGWGGFALFYTFFAPFTAGMWSHEIFS